jgi:hypothetical protein
LAACDVHGFILQACELIEKQRSADDNDPTRGTINRDRFTLWVETCLVPVLGKYELGEPRSIVVLDNASIHHGDEIVKLIEEACVEVINTAPYSPEHLNPIEYMFSKYKKCSNAITKMSGQYAT